MYAWNFSHNVLNGALVTQYLTRVGMNRRNYTVAILKWRTNIISTVKLHFYNCEERVKVHFTAQESIAALYVGTAHINNNKIIL